MIELPINTLSISYPDFKLFDVIDPDEVDVNNSQIVTKVNELVGVLNTLATSDGAGEIGIEVIAPFVEVKLQPLLNALITKVQGTSGAEFVGVKPVVGVAGANVQTLIESLKTLIDNVQSQVTTHKSAAVLDHPDGSVTNAKLATDSVTSGKIQSGAVTNPKVAAGAITYDKLADDARTFAQVVPGTGISTSKDGQGRTVIVATGTSVPGAHANTHASGGSDPITPAMIGAETPAGAQAKVDVVKESLLNNVIEHIALTSQAEFDNYVDTLSNTLSDRTHYTRVLYVNFPAQSMGSSGRIMLEGFRSSSIDEYQVIRGTGANGLFYRRKTLGFWTQWDQEVTTSTKGAISHYGTTNNVNDYTVTTTPLPSSYYDGFCAVIKIRAGGTNTGVSTLDVNGLGVRPLKKSDGSDFSAGELIAGSIYTFRLNNSSGNFILQGEGGGDARVDFDNYVVRSTVVRRTGATSLSQARQRGCAETLNNTAIIFGGANSSGQTYTLVETYDKSLVRGSITSLTIGRYASASACNDSHALLAGGLPQTGGTAQVDAYNVSFVRSSIADMSNQNTWGHGGGSIGGNFLFAGGRHNSIEATVIAYAPSLVKSTITNLTVARMSMASAKVGGYLIFAGGVDGGTRFNTVNAYNASLVMTTATTMTEARGDSAGTTLGDYALIGGGRKDDLTTNSSVNAYSANLVRSTISSLSTARYSLNAIDGGDVAMFVGGSTQSTGSTNAIDVYSKSLVKQSTTGVSMPASVYWRASTRIGDTMIFSGGYNGSNSVNTVDTYVDYDADVPFTLTSGSTYNFGGGDVIVNAPTTVRQPAPVTGYVKYKKGVLSNG